MSDPSHRYFVCYADGAAEGMIKDGPYANPVAAYKEKRRLERENPLVAFEVVEAPEHQRAYHIPEEA